MIVLWTLSTMLDSRSAELFHLEWLRLYTCWTVIPHRNPDDCRLLIEQFFFFYFNFYWNVLDLQYCVSFLCTAEWISYTYTYVHSVFRFFPHIDHCRVSSRVPCAIQEVLISYLFIHSNVYMSVPSSPFIPPQPLSPLVTINLFYLLVTISAL